MSTVSALAGAITRTWNFVDASNKAHVVQLYHNTMSGDRLLTLDGVEIAGTSGTTTIFNPRKTLLFMVGEQRGEVSILFHGPSGHVEYHCNFDGSALLEANSVTADSAEEAARKLRVSVEKAEIGNDEAGKSVVWFTVSTLRESDNAQTKVHRRFRDFYSLGDTLRSSFKGSPLLASFPALPSRSFKLFENHLSEEFMERRRWQLTEWLQKVVDMPRVKSNPEFLVFIGMLDEVTEVSVMFPPEQKLGLQLVRAGAFVEVRALETLADGSKSAAQLSGLVHPGYRVSKVNGLDCLSDPYDVVIARLRSVPRPMCLHFLGIPPNMNVGAISSGAGAMASAGVAADAVPSPIPMASFAPVTAAPPVAEERPAFVAAPAPAPAHVASPVVSAPASAPSPTAAHAAPMLPAEADDDVQAPPPAPAQEEETLVTHTIDFSEESTTPAPALPKSTEDYVL